MSDLISRQDAMNNLRKWLNFPHYNNGERNIIACAIAMLEEMPSAERKGASAERKGEWIRNMDSLIGVIQKPYCSVCGHSAIGNHGFDCIITNFCPNCGARMVSEDD